MQRIKCYALFVEKIFVQGKKQIVELRVFDPG